MSKIRNWTAVSSPPRTFEYMYCEPPIARDILQVLECANGLRPLSDLDPVVWLDTTANLQRLVDGQ
jgi:hypothetical protein